MDSVSSNLEPRLQRAEQRIDHLEEADRQHAERTSAQFRVAAADSTALRQAIDGLTVALRTLDRRFGLYGLLYFFGGLVGNYLARRYGGK